MTLTMTMDIELNQEAVGRLHEQLSHFAKSEVDEERQ
ncbi:MAG: hypothetical protein JWQ49_4586 [Edaphobacter sp.]|nr:hypothetical protein [Edaphobacter sp.]